MALILEEETFIQRPKLSKTCILVQLLIFMAKIEDETNHFLTAVIFLYKTIADCLHKMDININCHSL